MPLTDDRITVLCLVLVMLCRTEMILAEAYIYREMVMATATTQECIDSEDVPHVPATKPYSIC